MINLGLSKWSAIFGLGGDVMTMAPTTLTGYCQIINAVSHQLSFTGYQLVIDKGISFI